MKTRTFKHEGAAKEYRYAPLDFGGYIESLEAAEKTLEDGGKQKQSTVLRSQFDAVFQAFHRADPSVKREALQRELEPLAVFAAYKAVTAFTLGVKEEDLKPSGEGSSA